MLDEAVQERYQLAFGKGAKRGERRFAATDRSEGVGAQPNSSAGHLPRQRKTCGRRGIEASVSI